MGSVGTLRSAMFRIQLLLLSALVMIHFSMAVSEQEQLQLGGSATATFRNRFQSLEREWGKDLNGMAPRPSMTPLERVMKLLLKMKKELEEEKEKDLELYDKMKCWCETNSRENKKKLKYDKSCIRDRTDEIEERSHAIGVWSAQIPRMEIDLFKIKQALLEADKIRKTETEKFHLLQQDLSQTIINAKNAITILGKHHGEGASFMQPGSPLLSSMQSVLRELAFKHELIEGNWTDVDAGSSGPVFLEMKSKRRTMTTASKTAMHRQDQILMDALDISGQAISVLPVKFAQKALSESAEKAIKGGFLQTNSKQPGVYESYASQSGQIFGILKQMLDDFEKELLDATRVENKAKAKYDLMQKVGYAEIASLSDRIYQTKVLKATNLKKLSDAKMYLKGCYKEEADDKGFQEHLKTTCQNLDFKWKERSAARAKEIRAISEAITILLEDDNRETLYNSMKYFEGAKFLQVSSTETQRRSRAVAALQTAMTDPAVADDDDDNLMAEFNSLRKVGVPQSRGHVARANNPRKQLSVLVTHVKKSSFTKIKILMDNMIKNLKKQQADEVDFKAQCLADIRENEVMRYKKKEEIGELEDVVYALDKDLSQAKSVIAVNTKRIPEAEKEIRIASQSREEENADFQMMMAGQYATQNILEKVLKRLQRYYTKKEGGDGAVSNTRAALRDPSLVNFAQQEPGDMFAIPKGAVETPEQFGDYKKNKGASPVIGFIEQILEDSKKLTADGVTNENSSQKDYEKTVADLNNEIQGCKDKIQQAKKLMAEKEWQRASKQSELDSANEEFKALIEFKGDLHDQCDFVLKNYEVRQQGRKAEIEGILAAKANLDGGKVTLNKDCSFIMCPKKLCWDGKGLRQVGDDCCACPALPDKKEVPLEKLEEEKVSTGGDIQATIPEQLTEVAPA